MRAMSNSPIASSDLLCPHTFGVDLVSFLDVMQDCHVQSPMRMPDTTTAEATSCRPG
jgi:hypothetical protein